MEVKKRNLILCIFSLNVIFLLFFAGCGNTNTNNNSLSELQINACNSADTGGTCDTKLQSLDIISKEECCNALKKCC